MFSVKECSSGMVYKGCQ